MGVGFSSLNEAYTYLTNLPSSLSLGRSRKTKLHTMYTLMHLCNNPHTDINLIHVTGSKGKSTVAHTLGILLHQRGYTTGVFTSPHISAYNERICIDGKSISDCNLLKSLNFVLTQIHTYQKENPNFAVTFFEFLVATGFVCFKFKKCQWAVIEVGIGGRYDTTNFIKPKICVFTEIELEHTKILGSTVTDIAFDKAGIIKPQVPVWIGNQAHKEALSILQKVAQEQKSVTTYVPDIYHLDAVQITRRGTRARVTFYDKKIKPFTFITPSIGEVLLENQLLAYYVLKNYFGNQNFIHNNINNCIHLPPNIVLPARCEVLPKILGGSFNMPITFLDGAHTVMSIKHVCQSIKQLFSPCVLIFGMGADKNIKLICTILKEYSYLFKHILITRAGSFKPSNPKMILDELQKLNIYSNIYNTEREAMQEARFLCKKEKIPLCVLGSFYLCAECRNYYMENYTKYMLNQNVS